MGIMLPKPVMTTINERTGNDYFRVGSACVNGYRENMEDAHLIYLKPDWGFFGVFDGHVNDHCSAYLENEWRRVMDEITLPITDERMKEIALEIDRKYLADNPQGGSTGTFFLARVKDNKVSLQVGNVGDSRVLLSVDGQCKPMTEDHKPTNPGERRRILMCGGTVENARVNGSLALSRAFGDADYKRFDGDQLTQQVISLPDVTTCEVEFGQHNYAVLACDGVFEGEFSNEEVITFVNEEFSRGATDLPTIAFHVCEEAIRRGSKDNISCMIVEFACGSDYQNVQHTEFVPGPLAAPNHSGFMKAYWGMSAKAGISNARCLELRYDSLSAQDQSDEDLAAERSLFQGGPPPTLSGAARTEWFETIVQNLRGMGSAPTDSRAALFTQLQQRGISINAFLDAMRSAEADLDDN